MRNSYIQVVGLICRIRPTHSILFCWINPKGSTFSLLKSYFISSTHKSLFLSDPNFGLLHRRLKSGGKNAWDFLSHLVMQETRVDN